jgi:hypothetical protein
LLLLFLGLFRHRSSLVSWTKPACLEAGSEFCMDSALLRLLLALDADVLNWELSADIAPNIFESQAMRDMYARDCA